MTPEQCTTPNPDGIFYDIARKEWRCELWAENWPAIQFYTTFLITQWRVGMNGPVGLDYNVLLHELDRRKLDADEYEELFASLRVIENAVLNKPA